MRRRAFLLGSVSSAVVAGALAKAAFPGDYPRRFVSAVKDPNGDFAAVVLDESGTIRANIPLDQRGHGAAYDPASGRCVIFSRRPGNAAWVFPVHGNRSTERFSTPSDRHFYGHGVFSSDGALLYATENAFEQSRGVVGVYDVTHGFQRQGELDSGGIGPHEILLLPDDRTLVVANGGIATHPDYGRTKLNLDTMAPSLALLDRHSGALLGRYQLDADLHRLSLRHLAVDYQGSIWFGCQFEGPDSETPPLVGKLSQAGELRLFQAPQGIQQRMRNYVGSVAVSRDRQIAATSSPRGGIVVYWEAATGRYLGHGELPDVCGIAPAAGERGFLLTSGKGIIDYTLARGEPLRIKRHRFETRWDNHILAL